MPLFAATEKALLEQIVGRSPEAKRYVMLLTAAPTAGMTLAEVEAKRLKYTGYADIETTKASWGAASGEDPASITNSAELSAKEWEAGANEEATYFAIREEGKLVGYEKLTAGVVVGAGNKTASFAVSTLTIKLT